MTTDQDFIDFMKDQEDIDLTRHLTWGICPDCQGEGHTHLHSMVITADDFAEDPDFYDDYMAGRYKTPCPANCQDGKVKVLELHYVTEAIQEAHRAWHYEMQSLASIEAQERAMGA